VVESARRQDVLLEDLQEVALGGGGQVEPVGQAVLLEVLDQGLLDALRVVPVVERPGSGEEVDVAGAVVGDQEVALGGGEGRGEGTGVGADR
jgi:hypothetical protein